MNIPGLVAVTTDLEHDVERQLRRETEPAVQRRLLAIYRHSRALRIALEQASEATNER